MKIQIILGLILAIALMAVAHADIQIIGNNTTGVINLGSTTSSSSSSSSGGGSTGNTSIIIPNLNLFYAADNYTTGTFNVTNNFATAINFPMANATVKSIYVNQINNGTYQILMNGTYDIKYSNVLIPNGLGLGTYSHECRPYKNGAQQPGGFGSGAIDGSVISTEDTVTNEWANQFTALDNISIRCLVGDPNLGTGADPPAYFNYKGGSTISIVYLNGTSNVTISVSSSGSSNSSFNCPNCAFINQSNNFTGSNDNFTSLTTFGGITNINGNLVMNYSGLIRFPEDIFDPFTNDIGQIVASKDGLTGELTFAMQSPFGKLVMHGASGVYSIDRFFTGDSIIPVQTPNPDQTIGNSSNRYEVGYFVNISASNICYTNGSNCKSVGNPFDQNLNKSSNVTFDSLNLTGDLIVSQGLIYVNRTTGRIGIGTTNPGGGNLLDVNGLLAAGSLGVVGNAAFNSNVNISATNARVVIFNASAYAGQVMCYTTGGEIGHCTGGIVALSGACTCARN